MAEVRSGSFKTSGYSDPGWPDHYVFSWELTSQSIEGNYSDIKWSLTARGTNVGSGNFTNVKEKYVTVNGSTQSNATLQTTYNGTVPFSGTARIYHNSLGTGSFSASAGGAFFYYGSYNSTGKSTWDLPAIQRATTPVLATTNITMGASVNITLTPENSTFKHKIRYDFGAISGSAEGISIGAEFTAQGNSSVAFTPPTSLGSQIPNAMSGTGKIICYTYMSNGTHIGTKTVDITLNVPAYTPEIIKPSLTSKNTLNGEYVSGKSSAIVDATETKTYYGATIKSVTTVIDGETYSSLPAVSKVLSSGSKTAKITLVDSRGKSVTVETPAITVYAYSIPNITQFTLERQSNGTTVIATVNGSISAINNKNAKTITVTLNGVTNTIASSSYTINATTTFTGVSTDKTLTSTLTIKDSYTTVTKDAVLPTVAVTMDFYKDGNGIAMGKVSESGDLLDVAWGQRIRKDLQVDGTINGLTINDDNYITGGSVYASSENWVGNEPSFIGTYSQNDIWYNTISVRHRNGKTDGVRYGMQLRSKLTASDNLSWRQHVGGSWLAWRTLLDTNNTVDYVIEQGTYSDGWEYTKWNGGRIELWADKSITFPEPTNMGNYLWRSIYSLDMSSKLKSIISGTCCVQYSGMLPTFSRHSTILTMGEIVVATSKSFTGFTTVVPIYIIGRWK